VKQADQRHDFDARLESGFRRLVREHDQGFTRARAIATLRWRARRRTVLTGVTRSRLGAVGGRRARSRSARGNAA
jgi:hypothetical protein